VILAQRPVRSFEQVSEESHAREQNLAARGKHWSIKTSIAQGDNQAFGILQGDDSRVTRYRRKLLKKLVERVTCATQKFQIPSGVNTFEIRGVAGELLFLQPQGM